MEVPPDFRVAKRGANLRRGNKIRTRSSVNKELEVMPITTSRSTMATASSAMSALLPIMTIVFISFLIIGMALPVLPLHVHRDLGLSTFVVGLVTGSQFVAALLSRVWSGHCADRRGPKQAVVIGLL